MKVQMADERHIYALLPKGSDPALVPGIQAHYDKADPRVEVIVDRRSPDSRPPEQRVLRGPDGQRQRDRRRRAIPRKLALPPEEIPGAADLKFVQRLMPLATSMEDLTMSGVLAGVRSLNSGAATELYWRSYERIHSRLMVLLGNETAADEETPRAFGRVIDALESPDTRDDDYDAVLYREVDEHAMKTRLDDVVESVA